MLAARSAWLLAEEGWLDTRGVVGAARRYAESGGAGRFQRRYSDRSVVTVTAPAHGPNGSTFEGWRINGIMKPPATGDRLHKARN